MTVANFELKKQIKMENKNLKIKNPLRQKCFKQWFKHFFYFENGKMFNQKSLSYWFNG